MSIERSGTANSSQIVTGIENQGAKSRVKSGDEVDTSVKSGFSAILTSLEPQADEVQAADIELTAEEKAKKAAEQSSDPIIPSTSNLPTDLSLLLEQAGKVAVSKSNLASNERPGGGKGGNFVITSAVGTDKPEASMTASAALDSSQQLTPQQNVNPLLNQMVQGAAAQARKTRSAELQADVAAKLVELRANKMSSLQDVSARESVLSGSLVTSILGDGFLCQTDRATAKSSILSSGAGIEGIWGQQALGAGSRVDTPSVMTEPAMQSLESRVADTVSYWVTQGVQNAQLKLDDFGGKAVEVSISLKGDEAHIGFRTDQPEIRQILEGAAAHLKELLTSEGLILSGVSVGASGQDGTGAQEQRNRPSVRQVTVVTTDAVPTTETSKRVNKSVGRAVDLFV